MKHVVGVKKKYCVIRIAFSVFAEGRVFAAVVHNPAVCHGAAYRYAELLSCENRRRTYSAADICCTGTVYGCIHVMGAACAEIRYCAALCRLHDAVGFCGYE